MLLKAASVLKTFKSFVYKQNDFGVESMKQLNNFFSRKLPHQLIELKLVNCRINILVMQELVKLVKDRSQIQSLALVRQNLGKQGFNDLCHLV